MKLHQLITENDDLKKAHKDLMANIKGGVAARIATHNAMYKDHKWKYDVGDMIMSKKTGKIYTITAQMSQKAMPRDETGLPIKGAKQVMMPSYRYKAGDEEGTLLEPLIKPGMFSKVGKVKSPKEDDE